MLISVDIGLMFYFQTAMQCTLFYSMEDFSNQAEELRNQTNIEPKKTNYCESLHDCVYSHHDVSISKWTSLT